MKTETTFGPHRSNLKERILHKSNVRMELIKHLDGNERKKLYDVSIKRFEKSIHRAAYLNN